MNNINIIYIYIYSYETLKEEWRFNIVEGTDVSLPLTYPRHRKEKYSSTYCKLIN